MLATEAAGKKTSKTAHVLVLPAAPRDLAAATQAREQVHGHLERQQLMGKHFVL